LTYRQVFEQYGIPSGTLKSDRVIGRRVLLIGIAALLGAPRVSSGQTSAKVPRVLIYTGNAAWRDGLVGGLRDLGWIEGQNVVVEWRRAEPPEDPAQVEELGRLHPDAAVVAGPQRIRGAMKVTQSIPLVGVDLESDPVASGFVKSLARPGSNISGIWLDLPELAGKQLQFLREVLPALRRVGIVWDDRIGGPQFAETQSAARAMNVKLAAVPLHRSADADEAMRRLFAERPQAILILTSPVTFTALSRIAEVARQKRLPSITPFSPYPAAGGLMAYGPNFPAIWRQAAGYVHRILKGAKVGDLPVERPSKFELVINLKTAKALGLTIPPSLLLRADQVIE